ncbi:MAG: MBL fold metallo-hydrolase [Firmicutes bacterium]|nr:MBL fold metallo-hydrolase [Bacillota bacterium]
MLIKIDYGDVVEFKAARTILNKPLYFSHFFYIDGLLIDTGFAHVSREVLEAVKKLPVEKIVITHQHEDHTGNIDLLRRELGVPVYAHPETIKVLENPPKIEIYRKLMWGSPLPAKPLPVEKDYKLKNYTINTIYTPGHSIDHTCYFEPQNGYLFCGDLYLGESLTGFMVGENIADHFKSLEKILALKPKVLFCGLKGRLENALDRLRSKYEIWWNLGCQVKELYDAKASRSQIMKKVFGGEIYFYYFSQDNWGRRYMIDSILDNIDIFDHPTKISL